MDKAKRKHRLEAESGPPEAPPRGKPWSRKTRGAKEAAYYEYVALKLLLLDADLCNRMINEKYTEWDQWARGAFHNAAVTLLRKHESALGLCATIGHAVRIRRALLRLVHEQNRRIHVNTTGNK